MTNKRRNEARRAVARRDDERGSIPVPSANDWGRIPADDLDMAAAHELYFGKSCPELWPKFSRLPISMVDGLRWMPVRPFAYYLRCLAEFLMSDQVSDSAAPDLASMFLRLIEEKAKTCPPGIRANMRTVREAVEYVANNQQRFLAAPEIYGDFAVRAREIRDLLDSM